MLIKLFAPRIRCVFCGNEVPPRRNCVCEKCELPLSHIELPLPFPGVAAFSYDEPVRSLIHRFKYANSRYIAQYLGDAAARAAAGLPLPQGTIVMPIPLHEERLRERGYNQSELLARHIANALALKCDASVLSRVENTRRQTELTGEERRQNVVGAFRAARCGAAHCDAALLVDDVCTSGSTLLCAAQALQSAGCGAVFAVTAACALKRQA